MLHKRNPALPLPKALTLVISLSLTGCVGVAMIGSTGTEEVISNNSFAKPDGDKIGHVKIGSKQGQMTKKGVLRAWGNPDKILVIEKETRWIYHKELAWHGALVMIVVVPVPLIIPWGYRDIEVVMNEEKVSRILYHYSYIRYCGASLFGLNLHGLTLGEMSCEFKELPWKISNRFEVK